jgi:DNA-binding NarL/FixJ family response regulator
VRLSDAEFRSLLSFRLEWRICGEAGDGIGAVEKAKTLEPDLVLMDISTYENSHRGRRRTGPTLGHGDCEFHDLPPP